MKILICSKPAVIDKFNLLADSELERKLFYLEEFIGQKGFWKESQKYIEEYRGEPIPFEIK